MSCHNNTLTAMTVAAARKKALPVDDQIARAQLTTIGNYIETLARSRAAGHRHSGRRRHRELHPARARRRELSRRRGDRRDGALPEAPAGRRRPLAHPRAPAADRIERHRGDRGVDARAAALRAQARARAEYDRRHRARRAHGCSRRRAVSTEERAFQLLGLAWAGRGKDVDSERRARALDRRAAARRRVVAVAVAWRATRTRPARRSSRSPRAAHSPSADAVYKRGVQFLLNTQFADGSWFVKSRAIPLQPHFESGFPFGGDQFISAAGSNWAARALTLAYSKSS